MTKTPKRLPYRGKEIVRLKLRIAALQKRLDQLVQTSRAFKTEDEYLRWKGQFGG